MQLHAHIGLDTRIGKTLTLLQNLVSLYRTRRILVLDMDNYGPKVYNLLGGTSDDYLKTQRKFGVYRIRDSNVYVASLPTLASPNQFFQIATDAVNQITEILRKEKTSPAFEFDHVLIDTSHSIKNYNNIDAALALPANTNRLKFWLNYDNTNLTFTDTPKEFWAAFDKLQKYHSQLMDGAQRDLFIHVFNPAGLLTLEERRTQGFQFLANMFNVTVYWDLVILEAGTNNWIGPEHIVKHVNPDERVPSFDTALQDITSGVTPRSRGAEIAKWWIERHPSKPTNVVFIPIDKSLEDYRANWQKFPFHTLEELEARLGEVMRTSALKAQAQYLATC